MTEQLQGACLCGELTFNAALPSIFHVHCHCRMCQRAHGAAFVTWVGVAADRFELKSGQDYLVWYASSQEAERGFCSRCGSTVFFRSDQWPGEMHIARALIDGPVDREPERHVYFDSHVAWVGTGDNLPQCRAGSLDP